MKRLARTIGALGSLVLPAAYGEVPDGTRVTGGGIVTETSTIVTEASTTTDSNVVASYAWYLGGACEALNGERVQADTDLWNLVRSPVVSARGETLRLADGSGDHLVVDGAASFTVSADGRIAAGTLSPKGTEIVVLEAADKPAATWFVSEYPLVILAWADQRLFVLETHGESGVAPDLLAIDGADEATLVRSGAGLLAVSPDGKTLLLDTLNPATGLHEAVVVSSDNFEQIGVLRPQEPDARPVVGRSEWSGAGITATIWTDEEQRVAVFESEGKDYCVAQSIPLPKEVLFGLVHPRVDVKSGEITGWARDSRVRPTPDGAFPASPYLMVNCSIDRQTCTTESIGEAVGQVSRVFTRSATAEQSE